MSEELTPLPLSDVDLVYNTTVMNSIVEKEISSEEAEEVNTAIKPVSQTSSFYTLIAASLASLVVLFLVNKGILSSSMQGEATQALIPLFNGLIVVAVGYVAGKFIEGRSKVSVAKLQAQTALLALSHTSNGYK